MKRIIIALALALFLVFASMPVSVQAYTNACWGQASAAFAQTGVMGLHASQESTPREGLANLANHLYEEGVLDAPTLQALGAFLVSLDPNLTIEACME